MHAAVSILLAAGIGVAGAVSPGAVGPVGVAASQAQTSASAAEGPGGPILVVTSATSTFGDYYAEILRNEGLNAFAVADIGTRQRRRRCGLRRRRAGQDDPDRGAGDDADELGAAAAAT